MSRLQLSLVLLVLGAGWGLTMPLTKIAVSQGYMPFGMIFWQLVLGALGLGAYRLAARKPLALHRNLLWFFLLIAALGTVLPSSFSYRAAANLPAGVMAVIVSLVPIVAFPVAMSLGMDRFRWVRMLGLVTGLAGVVLLVGPDSLPEPDMVLWIPVALIAPCFYAFEGNIVAKWGTHGLGAGHVLFGASVVGAILVLPMALATGQFIDPFVPWGAPEWSLVALSLIHAAVYTGYVWLVSQAGAVFAAQVAYLVTGSGVLWSMALLGERYSGWVWTALLLILAGMFLVQPRGKETLAP